MEGNGFRSRKNEPQLKGRARLWATPVAQDTQRSPEAHMAMKEMMGRLTATSLTVQMKMWPTPRASDGTRGSDPPHGDGGPSLKTKVLHTDGLHSPTTRTDGNDGSPKTDLNPQFVAVLMGLPRDWLTPSTLAATDSSPNAQLPPGPSSPTDSER